MPSEHGQPDGIDVETLRAFARERVETSSVRKVAAAVGCNASTLHKFVTTESVPYPRLRRLLDAWYRAETGEEEGETKGSAQAAALATLTTHLSPGLRPAARRVLLSALASFHASTGTRPPSWLSGEPKPGRTGGELEGG